MSAPAPSRAGSRTSPSISCCAAFGKLPDLSTGLLMNIDRGVMNIECYSVTVSVWVTCHHQIMETGGRSSTLWAGADLIVMKTEGLLCRWV